MEIIIHNEVRTNLSDEEYKYLILLEFHEGFEESVLKARTELGIPLTNDIADQKLLYEKSMGITRELNLPIQLLPSVMSIVERGQVISVTHRILVLGIESQWNRKILYNSELLPPPYSLNSNKNFDGWYQSNQYVLSHTGNIEPALPLIQINKRLTKKELFDTIIEKWEDIDKAMTRFEKSTPFPTDFVSITPTDFETLLLIYRLRKEDLPHKEIYRLLKTKHSIFYADEDQEVIRKYAQIHKLLLKMKFIKK